ncbi:MAG: class I SAM-dependent methyltransferase, partial [Anaerolineae bacterium]|nr:class I SAM-dependent methyltransferase [Anaerolineae bacterium]
LAQRLSAELGIPATFLCADVYDLPRVLPRQFDVVFTSYGVLCWLPDLDRWAQLVAHHLRPGGTFYMVEFHPILTMLDDAGETLAYPYFRQEAPLRFEARGSYAAPEADFVHTAYEWPYSLGEVVTALVRAGLCPEFLHEFPYSTWGCWPFLEEVEPGKWVWQGRRNHLPHLFSVRARRAGEAEGLSQSS